MSEGSLLDFPCEIPVKVLGRNDTAFREAAWTIVRSHYAKISEECVSEQPSRESTYLSLTFVVHAQNREQVDALYRELTSSNDVMLVL